MLVNSERYPTMHVPELIHMDPQVQQLRREVTQLRKEVNVLSRQVALFWHPARANWERHTAPKIESGEMPTLKLPIVQALEIVRVTIDDSPEQYVRSYRRGNHLIQQFSGPFEQVGLKVLERAGSILWEMIPAPPPRSVQETPIPECVSTI